MKENGMIRALRTTRRIYCQSKVSCIKTWDFKVLRLLVLSSYSRRKSHVVANWPRKKRRKIVVLIKYVCGLNTWLEASNAIELSKTSFACGKSIFMTWWCVPVVGYTTFDLTIDHGPIRRVMNRDNVYYLNITSTLIFAVPDSNGSSALPRIAPVG